MNNVRTELGLLSMILWYCLTHLPLVPHIHASVNRVTIVSDYGLSPIRRQAITWTNAGSLYIGTIGTNFRQILIEIKNFSVKKMHLKMSSAKMAPILSRGRFCLIQKILTIITSLVSYLCGMIDCQNNAYDRIWWLTYCTTPGYFKSLPSMLLIFFPII